MEVVYNPLPRSYLFYIIANVGFPGTNDSHRPLAVTYRQGHSPGPTKRWSVSADRAQELVDDCASIVTLLSEQTNRAALEAELSSAVAWYRGKQGQDAELPRPVIADAPQPPFAWDNPSLGSDRPELPWAAGIREFPLISSCLRLALNRPGDAYYQGSRPRRKGDVQEQPLGTAFDNSKLEYGMVVIDISDLDDVRYGIVARRIEYWAEDFLSQYGFDGCLFPPTPMGIHQEKPGSPQPMSWAEFMSKSQHNHHHYDRTEASKLLGRHQVVDVQSLDYIWPRSDASLSPQVTPNADSSITRDDERLEDAVRRFIQDATECEDEPKIRELHRSTLDDPKFQAKLLSQLTDSSSTLGHHTHPSSTRLLLRLAYARKPHLNWVMYPKLTYEDMAAAIASSELQESAKALSICLDERGDDSPTTLLEVLARSHAIRDLVFLQGPDRADDEASSWLFSEICASPHASRFLGPRNIYLTCAYSAPLRRKAWLPEDLKGAPGVSSRTGADALLAAFPVQFMFVRQQFTEYSVPSDGDEEGHPHKFRPCHFFLGDALLKPERLVAGFSKYCRSVLSDRSLFSFTTGLRAAHDEADSFQGATISPIPAENSSIPEICGIASSSSSPSRTQLDCWPVFRALEPDGWVLLVSHEWHTTSKLRKRRALWHSFGRSGVSELGVPFVKYAFVKALKLLAWPDEGTAQQSPSMHLDTLVGPESGYIEVVGGAEDFLRQTAPEADWRLAGQCLGESEAVLQERWSAGLPEGMKFISTLDDSTASSMMRDFLEDSAHVRETMRTILQTRSEATEIEDFTHPRPRNSTIFKSLHDPDVHGPRPLGIESPNETVPSDDARDIGGGEIYAFMMLEEEEEKEEESRHSATT